MAKKKTETVVYRARQAFRRKNPATGQWVQFKPWNRYKLADVRWLLDYQDLFDKGTE